MQESSDIVPEKWIFPVSPPFIEHNFRCRAVLRERRGYFACIGDTGPNYPVLVKIKKDRYFPVWACRNVANRAFCNHLFILAKCWINAIANESILHKCRQLVHHHWDCLRRGSKRVSRLWFLFSLQIPRSCVVRLFTLIQTVAGLNILGGSGASANMRKLMSKVKALSSHVGHDSLRGNLLLKAFVLRLALCLPATILRANWE